MTAKNYTSTLILAAKNRTGAAFKGAGRNATGLTAKMRGVAGAASAAALAVGAIFTGTAIIKAKEFGKALGDLRAITGATTEAMEYYSTQAQRMGQTTVFTASQAAEAFKLMASARPELLKNAEALTAVTDEALLLAQAAGIELPEAALALGEAMNQFGADNADARKFVDTLAAGSKFGASAIPELSEALKNAGVAAKGAGLSFQETVGMLETLAAVGIKGSDAGTKMRSVLIKLQTQARDEFNPAVVGAAAALENLAQANLSVTDRAKIFGERSIIVGDALIANRKNFMSLTEEVDTNGVATDQAHQRYDNLHGDLLKLGSAFEALQIIVGQKYTPALRESTGVMTDLLIVWGGVSKGAEEASDDFKVFETILKGVTVAAFAAVQYFDILLSSIGMFGSLAAAIVTGSFEDIRPIIEKGSKNILTAMASVDEFAAHAFSDDIKKVIEENFTENVAKPVLEKAEELAVILPEALTAGEQLELDAFIKSKEGLQAKLETLRVSLLSEREVILEDYALKQEILENGLLHEELTKQEFAEREKELAIQKEEALLKIATDGAKARAKFDAMTAKAKLGHVLSEMVSLTAGVAQNNKAMFKVNKIAAMAEATIAIPVAASKAYAQYAAFPPLAAAMAALAAGAQIAKLQAIKSTSFGGGGGGTTPSASGSVPVINDIPVQPSESPALTTTGSTSQNEQRIIVEGFESNAAVSTHTAREIIDGIGQAVGDGVSIEVT